RERRKEQRDGGDDRELDERQHERVEEQWVGGRPLPRLNETLRRTPTHIGEHRVKRQGHDREIDGERQQQAGVFPEHELWTADRLGEQTVDAALLDLFRHETNADEDGDEETEDRRRGEPEVLDDLDVLSGGELADQV